MSSKDTYKLIFLGSSLVACSLTFFLPYNSVNGVSIQSLKMHPDSNFRFCDPFRDKLKEQCSGGGDETKCDEIREDVSDCLNTVKAAYEEINYKCLKLNALYQTCTMACDDEDESNSEDTAKQTADDENDCQKMCVKKKNELLDCEERIVQKWLRKEGLEIGY